MTIKLYPDRIDPDWPKRKIRKHMGPGPHPSGSPQSVHAGSGRRGVTSSPPYHFITVEEESNAIRVNPVDVTDDAIESFERFKQTARHVRSAQAEYQRLYNEKLAELKAEYDSRSGEESSNARLRRLNQRLAKQGMHRKASDYMGREHWHLQQEIRAGYAHLQDHAKTALPYIESRGSELAAEIEKLGDPSRPYDAVPSYEATKTLEANHPALQPLDKKRAEAWEKASEQSRKATEVYHIYRDEDWTWKDYTDDGDTRNTDAVYRFASVPADKVTQNKKGYWVTRRNQSVLDDDWDLRFHQVPMETKAGYYDEDALNSLRSANNDRVFMAAYEAKTLYGREYESLMASAKRYDRQGYEIDAQIKNEIVKLKGSYADEVAGVISKWRGESMGGEYDFTHSGPTKGSKVMAENARFFPSSWIERSNEVGPITIDTRDSRAHYNHQEAKLRIGGNFMGGDTLHESAHRFEHVVPEIVAIEKAFYASRIQGLESESLTNYGSGYSASERTTRDDFEDPYMGKHYSGGFDTFKTGQYGSYEAYELLSMAVPKVYGFRGDGGFTDMQYRNLMLGILGEV